MWPGSWSDSVKCNSTALFYFFFCSLTHTQNRGKLCETASGHLYFVSSLLILTERKKQRWQVYIFRQLLFPTFNSWNFNLYLYMISHKKNLLLSLNSFWHTSVRCCVLTIMKPRIIIKLCFFFLACRVMYSVWQEWDRCIHASHFFIQATQVCSAATGRPRCCFSPTATFKETNGLNFATVSEVFSI